MLAATIRLACAGLVCAACSQAPPPSGPPDGATLFREQNCITCHGPDGSGTNLGPMLRGKQAYWTREKLAGYLSDPQAVIKGDARLEAQAAKYMLPMLRFPLSLEQRLALADHVLGLP